MWGAGQEHSAANSTTWDTKGSGASISKVAVVHISDSPVKQKGGLVEWLDRAPWR